MKKGEGKMRNASFMAHAVNGIEIGKSQIVTRPDGATYGVQGIKLIGQNNDVTSIHVFNDNGGFLEVEIEKSVLVRFLRRKAEKLGEPLRSRLIHAMWAIEGILSEGEEK
jgi:hypothetical protein